MSQSPRGDAAGAENQLRSYRDAWSALSHLIGQGRSFSGRERNSFFLNTRDGAFAQAASAFGLDLEDDGRAVAICDWNGDGAQDIWLSCRTAPRIKLLLNQAAANRWLRIRLQGTTSNRDALGARVVLKTSEGQQQVRTVRAGDGFLSQSSKWLHFGLGAAEVAQVEVRWPSGRHDALTDLRANTRYEFREGAPQAEPWEGPRFALAAPSRATDYADGSESGATRTWIMGRVPLVETEYDEGPARRATDDFLGKPLLINLWSRDCLPCWRELREWSEARPQFEELGCQVLALSVDGLAAEGGAGGVTPEQLDWPFASGQATAEFVDGLELLQRTFLEWQRPLPVPSSFLLDEHGMLVTIYKGAQPAETVLQDVARLSSSPEVQRDQAVPFSGRWASEVFPSDPTPVVRRLEMHHPADAAVAYLNRYLQRFPSSAVTSASGPSKARQLLAWRHLAAKRFSELAPVLEQLRTRDPERGGLHRELAGRLLQARRPTDALPHFELALRQFSQDAALHHNAGLAAMGAQQPGRAVKWFARAAILAPDDAATQFHLGNAHQFQDNPRAALRHFAQALRLRPRWALPANNLAWILATSTQDGLRDGAKALATIEPFCADWESTASSSEAALLDTYVAALAETGDFAKAQAVNAKLLTLATREEQREALRVRQQRLEDRRPLRAP